MGPLKMQWLGGLQPQGQQGGLPGMGSYMPQMPSMAHQTQAAEPEAQEAPEQAASPLQLGSRAAMESVEMNDAQKRRAEGLAIMQFFSNMSKSKAHNQLGAINESFMPAAQAYQEEQARAQQLNAHNQKRQDAFDLARIKAQGKGEMSPYQKEMLRLKEAQIDAKATENSTSKVPPPPPNVKLPEDAIPLSEIKDDYLRKTYIDENNEKASTATPLRDNKDAVGRLRKIFKDNPNLYSSLARVTQAEFDKKPTVFLNMLGKANKKDVTALQEINKELSILAKNETKAYKGRTTDMFRQMINNTMPSLGSTPEAANYLMDVLDKEYDRGLKVAKKHADAKKYRYAVFTDLEGETPAPETPAAESGQGEIQTKVEQFKQEHPALANKPYDAIIEAMRLEGLL
jgi:hypothetical protein